MRSLELNGRIPLMILVDRIRPVVHSLSAYAHVFKEKLLTILKPVLRQTCFHTLNIYTSYEIIFRPYKFNGSDFGTEMHSCMPIPLHTYSVALILLLFHSVLSLFFKDRKD